MVSIHPFISKSSSPFNNPLVTVPKASISIGIIVTFMFHSFFNSLASSRCLSFFSFSFNLTLWSAKTAKSTLLQFLFFCLRSSLLVVYMSKSQRSLCVSFSRMLGLLFLWIFFPRNHFSVQLVFNWIDWPLLKIKIYMKRSVEWWQKKFLNHEKSLKMITVRFYNVQKDF